MLMIIYTCLPEYKTKNFYKSKCLVLMRASSIHSHRHAQTNAIYKNNRVKKVIKRINKGQRKLHLGEE